MAAFRFQNFLYNPKAVRPLRSPHRSRIAALAQRSTRAAGRAARSGPKARKGNAARVQPIRSEEHTSELQSLMRISYAVFCLKKKKNKQRQQTTKGIPTKTQKTNSCHTKKK